MTGTAYSLSSLCLGKELNAKEPLNYLCSSHVMLSIFWVGSRENEKCHGLPPPSPPSSSLGILSVLVISVHLECKDWSPYERDGICSSMYLWGWDSLI